MLMALRGDSEVAGTSWEKDTAEEGQGEQRLEPRDRRHRRENNSQKTQRGGEGGRSPLEQGEGGRARGGGGKEREARQG